MKILGIETSCDETAASVLEINKNSISVISNVVFSQIDIHREFGGVVPSIAAREHTKKLKPVTESALQTIHLDDVDLIAVTSGPGLMPALITGTTFAKTLAWHNKIPVISTNHIEGHIYSNWFPDSKSDQTQLSITDKAVFPSVCLVVSGGHTQLILMSDHGNYELIGQTLDDAAGEAFDKIARLLELGYPGGPAVAKSAERKRDAKLPEINLPRPMINSRDFNFSFSGLKTSVLYKVRDMKQNYSIDHFQANMAYEAQEAIVDVLVAKTLKATSNYGAKSVMLSGGVAANKRLREELNIQCEKDKIPLFLPNISYTGDNAAMIALAGYMNSKNHKLSDLTYDKVKPDSNWEIV